MILLFLSLFLPLQSSNILLIIGQKKGLTFGYFEGPSRYVDIGSFVW
jgi:hypothetical protein